MEVILFLIALVLAATPVLLVIRWFMDSKRFAELERRLETVSRDQVTPSEIAALRRRIYQLEGAVAGMTTAHSAAALEVPQPEPAKVAEPEPVPVTAPAPRLAVEIPPTPEMPPSVRIEIPEQPLADARGSVGVEIPPTPETPLRVRIDTPEEALADARGFVGAAETESSLRSRAQGAPRQGAVEEVSQQTPKASVEPAPIPEPAPPPAPVPPPPLFAPRFTQPEPVRPSRSSEEWEAMVGGNWLNKLGVFVLVIAIALFLGFSFNHMGPAGRSAVGLAISFALLIGGVIMERRPPYVIFGRGLIGGGWAGLYFTTYAMQAVGAAKIIHNPLLGGFLLLAVAAGMVVHSLRYRVQALTGLAYFMAFPALAITPVTAL